MAHYLTNRGKLLLIQGLWDDAGSSAVKIGLLEGSSVPAAIDTEAEIQDLDTVGALLALTSVDEPAGSWYARKSLTRSASSEDDTNNRVNMDADDVTWDDADTSEETHVYGGFWYDATTDTNDTSRLLCGVFTFSSAVALNGSDLTLTISDLVRAS